MKMCLHVRVTYPATCNGGKFGMLGTKTNCRGRLTKEPRFVYVKNN